MLYLIILITSDYELSANKLTYLNAIKGFMAVSLFSTVPTELYKLSISLQSSLTTGITALVQSAGSAGVFGGMGSITSPIMMLFILVY